MQNKDTVPSIDQSKTILGIGVEQIIASGEMTQIQNAANNRLSSSGDTIRSFELKDRFTLPSYNSMAVELFPSARAEKIDKNYLKDLLKKPLYGNETDFRLSGDFLRGAKVTEGEVKISRSTSINGTTHEVEHMFMFYIYRNGNWETVGAIFADIK